MVAGHAGMSGLSRDNIDIFINGGSQHLPRLKTLLPRMHPFGRVHLGSAFLTDAEIADLGPHCDFVHKPNHAPGWDYLTHILHCTRDLNTLATGKWFIKTDADTKLSEDWFEYVEEGVAKHPDAVMFGVRRDPHMFDVTVTGELARRRLGADIRIEGGRRMCGAFYVCNTTFFKKHDGTHQDIHDILWCHSKKGKRTRPSPCPDRCLPGDDELRLCEVRGPKGLFRWGFGGSEDTARSILVHFKGAEGRMHFLSSGGRIGQELL
jgi:hypothetical protein